MVNPTSHSSEDPYRSSSSLAGCYLKGTLQAQIVSYVIIPLPPHQASKCRGDKVRKKDGYPRLSPENRTDFTPGIEVQQLSKQPLTNEGRPSSILHSGGLLLFLAKYLKLLPVFYS